MHACHRKTRQTLLPDRGDPVGVGQCQGNRSSLLLPMYVRTPLNLSSLPYWIPADETSRRRSQYLVPGLELLADLQIVRRYGLLGRRSDRHRRRQHPIPRPLPAHQRLEMDSPIVLSDIYAIRGWMFTCQTYMIHIWTFPLWNLRRVSVSMHRRYSALMSIAKNIGGKGTHLWSIQLELDRDVHTTRPVFNIMRRHVMVGLGWLYGTISPRTGILKSDEQNLQCESNLQQ